MRNIRNRISAKVRNLKKRFYKKKGGGRNFGLRCKDYCAGCIVCDSYRFLDENGRFPYTFDEASDFRDQNVKEAEAWEQSSGSSSEQSSAASSDESLTPPPSGQ